MRVVGICGDVVHDWFDGRSADAVSADPQAPADALIFAVRTTVDPLAAVAGEARRRSRTSTRRSRFLTSCRLRQVLSEKTIGLQYVAGVMGAFAGLALMLAMLGLYAVMTYLVRSASARSACGSRSAPPLATCAADAVASGAADRDGAGDWRAAAIALGRAWRRACSASSRPTCA